MKLENPKLLTLGKTARIRERLRLRRRKFVLTNGAFDLLHPGHIHFLNEAAKLGDLYVALNSDRSVKALKGPKRPILGEKERAYALAQLGAVKGIVIFDGKRLAREISRLKPDLYVKAGDYNPANQDAGERDALIRAGAKIRFLSFLPGFSTTKIVARIRAAGSV